MNNKNMDDHNSSCFKEFKWQMTIAWAIINDCYCLGVDANIVIVTFYSLSVNRAFRDIWTLIFFEDQIMCLGCFYSYYPKKF